MLSIFAMSKSLGPLFIIITRLFKVIFLWILVFVIFAVSFQLGFISITKQAGEDPWKPFPEGTFAQSFFTILGLNDNSFGIMHHTALGTALLGIWGLLGQIVLANLLIAMINNTYAKVIDNADLEWKFYKLELMLENASSYRYLPPINLITVPIMGLVALCMKITDFCNKDTLDGASKVPSTLQLSEQDQIMVGKMCVARNIVLYEENHRLQESTLVERKMRDMDRKMEDIDRKLRRKFDHLERKFEYFERNFEGMEKKLDAMISLLQK